MVSLGFPLENTVISLRYSGHVAHHNSWQRIVEDLPQYLAEERRICFAVKLPVTNWEVKHKLVNELTN